MKFLQKANLTAMLGVLTTVGGSLIWILTNWNSIIGFVNNVDYIYDNVSTLEHVISDYHQLQDLTSATMQQNVELQVKNSRQDRKIDSLSAVISILSYGKAPYQDTVWYMNQYGQWIKSNIREHPNIR